MKKVDLKILTFVFTMLLFFNNATIKAQTITRGPYLQVGKQYWLYFL
jgi:hypothetical protein